MKIEKHVPSVPVVGSPNVSLYLLDSLEIEKISYTWCFISPFVVLIETYKETLSFCVS